MTSSFCAVKFCLFQCSKLNHFHSYIWTLINLFGLLHYTMTWLYLVYWFILLHCSVKSIKIHFIKLTCIFLKGQIVLKKILKSNSPSLCISAPKNSVSKFLATKIFITTHFRLLFQWLVYLAMNFRYLKTNFGSP